MSMAECIEIDHPQKDASKIVLCQCESSSSRLMLLLHESSKRIGCMLIVMMRGSTDNRYAMKSRNKRYSAKEEGII